MFEKYGGYKSGKLKLKKPKQLQVRDFALFPTLLLQIMTKDFLCWQEVLDIARMLLVELCQHNDCEIEEKKSKLEQLKTVLEM